MKKNYTLFILILFLSFWKTDLKALEIKSANRYMAVPPPSATNDQYYANTGQILTVPANGILINDSDQDGDNIVVTSFDFGGSNAAGTTGFAAEGQLTVNADGSFTFVPASGYTGTVYVQYTISDGNGGTDTAILIITVDTNTQNYPPAASDINENTPQDTTLNGNVLDNATDPNGDTLTITTASVDIDGDGNPDTLSLGNATTITDASSNPIGTITLNADGTYTFVPTSGYNGTVPPISFTVDDGNGGTDTANLNITVGNVTNQPPTANDDNFTTNINTTLNDNVITNNDTDPDGDNLQVTTYDINGTTYTADGSTITIPGQGDLTFNADGSFTFVPVNGFTGAVDTITYTITDGNGNTDTADLNITVNSLIAQDDTNSTNEDVTLTVTSSGVLFNDTGSGTLQVTDFTINGTTYIAGTTVTLAEGTFTLNSDGSYTLTPAPDFNGNFPTVTYAATDSAGGTGQADLDITVNPVNDPPHGNDDNDATNEDTTLTQDAANGVLSNDTDVDGDTLIVTQFVINGNTYSPGTTVNLAEGDFTLNADGSYTFVPTPGYFGSVPVITYTLSDGNETDTANLFITVLEVNNPPDAQDDTDQTNENTTLNGNAPGVLANDGDPDGDTITVIDFTINGTTYAPGTTVSLTEGDFTLNADGSYTFVPATNYSGPVPTVTYTISDGSDTDSANLDITVIYINSDPVAVDDEAVTPENTTLNGSAPGLMGNDSDADGDPLTITDFTVNGQTYGAGSTVTLTEGTLTINADGSYTFVPASGFTGYVPTITYTLSDGAATDTADFTIIVDYVNIDPNMTLESCNQGYTASGLYRIRYVFSLTNPSYAQEVNNLQIFNDLNAVFGNGCIVHIEREWIGTAEGYDNTDPLMFDDNSWDTTEFNETDPTPGQQGIFNAQAVSNNILYPGQSIWGAYCIDIDPNCAGGAGVGSGNGVTFDNILTSSGSTGNGNVHLAITDFHTYGTTLAAGIYVPNPQPLVNNNGTYDFDLVVTITNDGTEVANNVQFYLPLIDFINNSIPINSSTVTQTSGPAVSINTAYDPSTNGNSGILDNNVSLAPNQTIRFNIHYNVGPTTFNGTCNFPYPNPSMTNGPQDHFPGSITENPDTDTYVVWSDSQGNQLDKYYPLANPGDIASSEWQCNCNSVHISFDYAITLNIDKTIVSNVPAASLLSGNRDITFQIVVENDNSSDVLVKNLILTDNLSNICDPTHILSVSQPVITSSTATTDPNININFDGMGDTDIFDNSSGVLEPGQSLTIQYTVEVDDPCFGINYAYFSASDPSGHGTNTVNSGVEVEVWPDFDNDHLADNVDFDDDNDAILDSDEGCPGLKGYYYDTNAWVYSILSAVSHTYGPATAYFVSTNSFFNQGCCTLGYNTHLQDFLGADASSLSLDPSNKRRAIIKLVGYVYLEAGTHNFRVRANDGYRIRINWQSVAEVDHNQGTTTRIHPDFTVSESKYYPIEILYWNSGGTYALQIEMRRNGQSYVHLDTTNTRYDCDIDNDSQTSNLDLDADNDGIPDIIEGGGTDSDNDGQVDYPTPGNSTTMNDADQDGVDDAVDISQGGTPVPVPDTDGDGISDFRDIDADNDGIVDNIEAQTTAGYTQPTGVDSDGDGLDDAYDQDEFDDLIIGNGAGTAIVPVDTDNDGIPDYLDTNSDDDSDPDSLEGWDWDNNGIPDTQASGNDADGDGLDDAYDQNDVLLDPTNGGQTPASFPNVDVTNPDNDRDWREKYPHFIILKDDNLDYSAHNLNVGDIIYYDIVVINDGTVPLTNITVTDNNATFTSSNIISNLDVGDSVTITAEHQITLADLDAGIVSNSASGSCTFEGSNITDISDDPDPGSNTPGEGDYPTITHLVQAPELTVSKDDNLPYSPQSLAVGDIITYNIYVKNTGNVSLYNINVTDNNATFTSGTNPITVLQPGQTAAFTATHVITQADLNAGQISNQTIAETIFNGNQVQDLSNDPDINSSPDPDDPTITHLVQTPELEVTKNDNLPLIPQSMVVGDAINYEIIVTNTGNVTFTQVILTDNNANITGSNIINGFDPGQTYTFQATHIVTQADIDAGQVSNQAIADGDFNGNNYSDASDDIDPDSPSGQNDPTITLIEQNPSFYLTKDDAMSLTPQNLNVGDVITYYLKVRNTGNVTLTNINITDTNATFPSGSVIGSIAPGSSGALIAHHTVTQADIDAGQIVNSAEASLQFNNINYSDISDDLDPGAPAGPDDPTITLIQQTPQVTVTKDDNLAYVALPFVIGDVINYDIYVENSGNVTLTNIGITDVNAQNITGAPIASLAPGDIAHLTATHTITQDDIDAGMVLNSAIATTQFNNTPYDDTSDDTDPNSPQGDDDPTTTFIEQNPSLEITKNDGLAYVPQALNVGDVITYTIAVTNTGNVRLTDIDIVDNNAVLGQSNIASLDINQTVYITATHTITQSDLDTGYIVNSATATTTFNNNTVSDVSDDTDPASPGGDNDPTYTFLVQNPGITVTKDDQLDMVAHNFNVGDVISYVIDVYNSGNVTFNQIVVTDSNANIISGNPVLNLLPGQHATVTAEHIITQADIDAGQVVNSAEASGNFNNVTYSDLSDDTDPASPGGVNDPTVTLIQQSPELSVTKDDGLALTPHLLALGSTITYNVTVKNTGNVTLTNISLTDPNGTIQGSNLINSLTPNQTASFVVTHIITQADLDAGQVSNQAIASTVFNNANVSDLSDDLDLSSPTPGIGDDPTITLLQQVPAIELTKDDGLPYTDQALNVGDVIYYQIVVTNTGNVTLSQVDITDANAQIQGSGIVNNIAPGQSQVILAEHIITQADLDSGIVSNSATGTTVYNGNTYTDISDDADPASPSGNDDPTLTFLTQSPAMEVLKDDGLPYNAQVMNVGDIISYTIEVTNTGNVTLNDITVTDANANFTSANTIPALNIGQTVTLTAEHIVTQAELDAGFVSNSAIATTVFNSINVSDVSDDKDIASPPNNDDPTITFLTQNPGIEVTKDDQLPYVAQNLNVGDVIHYEIYVTNTGNVTFPQVSITDNNATIIAGTPILNLAPNDTAIVLAEHIITQADIDAGVVLNSAEVEAVFNNVTYSDISDDTDIDSPTGDNDPTQTLIAQNWSLSVTKDDGFSYTPQYLNIGDVITYTIAVTNTGNVTLNNISVTDNNAQFTGNNIISTLAPNQTVSVTAQHIVTQADIDAGQVSNQATATVDFNGNIISQISDDADPNSPTNPDDPTITFIQQLPEVVVLKDDQLPFTPQALDVGQTITYQITVYNTGNTTLNDITVTDNNAQFIGSNTITTLAPQASVTLIAQHTITQADLDAGVVANTAIASFDLNGITYQDLSDDTDPSSLPGNDDPTLTYLVQSPDITLYKDDGLDYSAHPFNVGDVINYDITVENTGNVTLTNITLTDNNANFVSTNVIGQLDVGQSITIQATHTVTQADIDAGQVSNQAVGTTLFGSTQVTDLSDDTDVASPSGDDDPTVTHIVQNPSMEVTKDDQLNYVPHYMQLNDIITYRIYVKNTGNVTLTNINIIDPNAVIPNGNPIVSIAPGSTQVVIAQHTITQADLDAGVVSNSATAQTTFNNVIYQDVSDDTDPDSPTPGTGDDPTLTFLEQNPEVVLTKDDQLSYNPHNMQLNDVITYHIEATNTGNVTLNVLTVTDDNATFTGANTIVSLAPGQSETLVATHTITQADLDAGVVSNSATITTSFNGVDISDVSDDTDPFSPGGDDDPTLTFLIQNPGVTLYKTDQLPYSAQNLVVGDVIHYQIIVENTGNITLGQIEVTDDNAVILSGTPIHNLAPGDQAVVLADHIVTQGDIDATQIINQAVGTFTYQNQQYQDLSDDLDPLSPPGPDDPTVTSIVAHPGIEVTKDDHLQLIPQELEVGDVVTYTVTVSNTGNITLTDVTVTDYNAVPQVTTIPLLEIGQSEVITLTHTVTQADIDAGQIVNSAEATTTFASQIISDVSDDLDPDSTTPGTGDDPTVTLIAQHPSIEVVKDDQLPYAPQLLTVGTVIDYNITVTNTGNVTFTNINVTDSNANIQGGVPIATIEPDASVTIHAQHTVTQADIDTGQIINSATVKTTFNGVLYSDISDDNDSDSPTPGVGDDATVTSLVQIPELTVTKDDNFPYSDQNLNVGNLINYTIVVENSGNVTLNNIFVTDQNAQITGNNLINQLLPGETATLTAVHQVTQQDIDAGMVENQAIAQSVFNNADVIDLSDDTDQMSPPGPDDPTITHITQHITYTVTKDDGLQYVPQNLVVGDPINYDIIITNTGNVSLVAVDVNDPNAFIISPLPISVIAPGQSVTIQAIHTVTQQDIDNEQVENQAIVTVVKDGVTYTVLSDDADPLSPIGDEDPTITFLIKQYDFELKKHGIIISVDPNQPMPGEKIQYIFELYNTGRQTISNINISDPLLNGNIIYQSGDVNGDGMLNTDEIWVYYADLILTQNMIDNGFVDNRAIVVGSNPSGTTLSDVSDDPNDPTDVDIEGDGEPDDITHTPIPQVKQLELLKTGVFNDENGDGLADVGETITYSFIVKNTGNVTIHDIQVQDPLIPVVGGAFNLEAGETNAHNFTATYFITQNDIENGFVINTATVTGKDPNGYQISDISDDPNNNNDVDVEGDGEPDDPTIVKTANIIPFEILTPNADGLNDFFRITGIESFPDNQVRIYNRWGNLVFTAYGYNNTDNYWKGTNMYDNDKELPVGVYYYVIDLGDGNIDKIFTGSVYLNK